MLGDALGDMAGFLDNIIDKLDVDGLGMLSQYLLTILVEDEVLGRDESGAGKRQPVQARPNRERKKSLSQKDEEEERLEGTQGDDEDDGDIKSDRGSFKVDDESSSQSSSPLKGENPDELDRSNER